MFLEADHHKIGLIGKICARNEGRTGQLCGAVEVPMTEEELKVYDNVWL